MQLTAACAEGTALLGKVHRDRTAVPLIALTRDKALLLKRFQGLGHGARGCLSAFGDVTGPDLPPLALKAGNRHNRVHLRRRDALGCRRLLDVAFAFELRHRTNDGAIQLRYRPRESPFDTELFSYLMFSP